MDDPEQMSHIDINVLTLYRIVQISHHRVFKYFNTVTFFYTEKKDTIRCRESLVVLLVLGLSCPSMFLWMMCEFSAVGEETDYSDTGSSSRDPESKE